MGVKWRITDAQSRPQRRAKDFALRMGRIPPQVKKRINQANEKSAEELAAMMVRLSPEPITGALTRSIRYYEMTGTQGGGIVWRVAAGNEEAFYARLVEFGAPKGAAPVPFFYASYRALRRSIKNRQLRAFRAALRETKR
jgi:hypothetical protein